VHGASESDPWYSELPVSDEKDPDREGADADTREDPGLAPESESEPESELDELDDLEGDGFDRAVAQARAQAAGLATDDEGDPELGERLYTQEEVGLRSKFGWGRSPIISAAVVIVGLFLLAATWGDFRYFLRGMQSGPRDLGHVTDIYQDGRFTERLDNQWVELSGEPDVQHAARMQGREGWIGFMRLIGADASMFVAVPRSTERASNQFPGRFEGRIMRNSEVAQWDRLQTFFDAEEIVVIEDLEVASVLAAMGSGATTVDTVAGAKQPLTPTDTLRVVVRQPAAVVQLGRTTWPSRAAADEIMQVFGRPWAFVEKRDAVWVYALDVGLDAKLELFQDLTKALNGGDDLATANAKVGGLVLPRRTTYLVEFGDLGLSEGRLSFSYGTNTAETGWQVVDGELVPVELVGGRLGVSVDAVEALRLERPLLADPNGYLIMVDQRPRDVWPSALMFGAVLAVVILNGVALVVALRRRRRGA
jgi:hypothetical protein